MPYWNATTQSGSSLWIFPLIPADDENPYYEFELACRPGCSLNWGPHSGWFQLLLRRSDFLPSFHLAISVHHSLTPGNMFNVAVFPLFPLLDKLPQCSPNKACSRPSLSLCFRYRRGAEDKDGKWHTPCFWGGGSQQQTHTGNSVIKKTTTAGQLTSPYQP